jgi:NAD+ kinase
MRGKENTNFRYTDACQVPEETECVITLGGDGTLIQAARDLAGRRIPILGVNLGNVGYLTQVGRQEEIGSLLDDLIADQYQLENRMMLKGTVLRDGAVIKEDMALNEVVIARREMLSLLKLQIYVNGEPLSQCLADGLIVATPTGSTAYNLSAGGPIVEPTANMTILTPICSHALNGRSIVLSSEDLIELEVLGDVEYGQSAAFDGDTFVYLKPGDRLKIEKSEIETVLVKLKAISFLDNLRNKLSGV